MGSKTEMVQACAEEEHKSPIRRCARVIVIGLRRETKKELG